MPGMSFVLALPDTGVFSIVVFPSGTATGVGLTIIVIVVFEQTIGFTLSLHTV